VRGTVERVYALPGMPSLTDEDLSGMSKEACEQAFSMYLSTLLSDARRYLDGKPDGEELHLIQDGVVVSRIELFLSPEENQEMNQRIQSIILEAGKNEPSPQRNRQVVTYLVIPTGS
jgi:hypothetical protein